MFSTEHYESFNHVFRLSCIHSNQQAPSWDSCHKFAYLDLIKHVISGGYWYERSVQKWVHAGPTVLRFVHEHPEQARLLGFKMDRDLEGSEAGKNYFAVLFCVSHESLDRHGPDCSHQRSSR